jgi:transposase
MSESTTVTVGLDVHAGSIRLAAVCGDELLEERMLPYEHEAVERALRRWPRARCCYEAGPTGFGLHRYLTERGIDCRVVAPGLVPHRPGERVKTDLRDARKLARLHAAALLEPIHVPSQELEAAGDLIRAREDARPERMAARHRLGKLLLRNDRRMPTTTWGVTRRRWLGQQRFDEPPRQAAFDDYLHALDLVDARIAALEREIQALAGDPAFAPLVGRLRCLRGVDTLTALGIVAEVGDFARFESAAEFMSFVGLVPSEHSSGERRHQGSITKTGNAHVRRLLVEAAWSAGRRPQVGERLAARQHEQDALVRARAWRCQQRLYRRWRRMAARGKPRQKIVVACARELAGIWAIATEQPLRARLSEHGLRLEQRNASDHKEDPRLFSAAPADAGDPRL